MRKCQEQARDLPFAAQDSHIPYAKKAENRKKENIGNWTEKDAK